MTTPPRTVYFLFLACLLCSAVTAQEDGLRWSSWRPVDEELNGVKIRTARDDNEGRGWADGSHRWRYEVKNTLPRTSVRVALTFPTRNSRTKDWEMPLAPTASGFTLEPGDVQEGTASGPVKEGFDYGYLISILNADGGAPKRKLGGFANSRFVAKPIVESSLIANRAFSAAQADERRIADDGGAAAVASPAPATGIATATPQPAKRPAPAAKPATAALSATTPTMNLPMTAATLPPVSVEGLGAMEKVTLWVQRAGQGDAESMFELGRACRFGQGTPQDHATATEWYRQAAIRGHAGAMTKLGFAYDSGLGIERNETLAIEWWQKAAALGEPDARKKLAKLGLAPAGE